MDALMHLLGAMSMGPTEYIMDQEKQGQQQIARGTRFPLDVTGMTRDEMEGIGFIFGESIDDLFQEITLPDGWAIHITDHSMWSDIVDDTGQIRGSIFYKAAFYDRAAFATVIVTK